jgi:hypothetical protein
MSFRSLFWTPTTYLFEDLRDGSIWLRVKNGTETLEYRADGLYSLITRFEDPREDPATLMEKVGREFIARARALRFRERHGCNLWEKKR